MKTFTEINLAGHRNRNKTKQNKKIVLKSNNNELVYMTKGYKIGLHKEWEKAEMYILRNNER